MSSQIAFCQSPVQRKSISIPVLSRSVREPWQSLHWWEKGFNTDLLLRFSIFMLLEAFKLCIIAALGSLIKAYTMQANLEFWVHLLQVDIKMCCVDQFSGDINSRDGINVLYMIKTLKPHLATQEAAQEASKALFLFIYFFLPSPGTTSGKVMRNPTLRGVCINKTTTGLKASQEASSHHCSTSLFQGLFLFCSFPQQLHLLRKKWEYCRWCRFISCREK